MSPNISKTGIKNEIPSFLKPTRAGSLIRMGHFKKRDWKYLLYSRYG
jgi:hypothetical protein